MPAPANDTRATSQAISNGPYYGQVHGGTTVDATEDAGGPVDGFGAQDVFYHWADVPAGAMFLYVQPRPAYASVYFEVAVMDGFLPEDWTSAETWTAFGYSDGVDTCRIVWRHEADGPVSVCVYTYSPDEVVFDFGWGHDLDPVAAHWGDPQNDDYETVTTGVTGVAAVPRHGADLHHTAPISGSNPPSPGEGPCAWSNARDGVIHSETPGVYGCSYEGPGLGDTASTGTSQDVGASYLATSVPSIPPAPTTTGRSDQIWTAQTIVAVKFPTTQRGADEITEQGDTPDGWLDWQDANEGPDQKLAWGYSFQGESTFDTANYELGTFTLTNTLTGSPYTQDDVDVTYRALPQALIVSSPGTTESAIQLDNSPLDVIHNYVLPDDTPADEIAALVDGGNDVVIADGPTAEGWMRHRDGETDDRWIVGLVASVQVLDDVEIAMPDPAGGGATVDVVASRTLAITGTPSYDTRVPEWRPYLGFPVTETEPSGWRLGRVGSGVEPW